MRDAGVTRMKPGGMFTLHGGRKNVGIDALEVDHARATARSR